MVRGPCKKTRRDDRRRSARRTWPIWQLEVKEGTRRGKVALLHFIQLIYPILSSSRITNGVPSRARVFFLHTSRPSTRAGSPLRRRLTSRPSQCDSWDCTCALPLCLPHRLSLCLSLCLSASFTLSRFFAARAPRTRGSVTPAAPPRVFSDRRADPLPAPIARAPQRRWGGRPGRSLAAPCLGAQHGAQGSGSHEASAPLQRPEARGPCGQRQPHRAP
jgi:hypothetical protein